MLGVTAQFIGGHSSRKDAEDSNTQPFRPPWHSVSQIHTLYWPYRPVVVLNLYLTWTELYNAPATLARSAQYLRGILTTYDKSSRRGQNLQ
jgi:hypothetical protein